MNIFQSLLASIDNWMAASNTNYTTFLISTLLLFAVCAIITYVFDRRIGKNDERTAPIKLRISNTIMTIGFVAFLAYVSGLTSDLTYISQLAMIPAAITGLAAAIVTTTVYRRTS